MITTTGNNIEEIQKYFARWKGSDSKWHTLCDSFSKGQNYRVNNNIRDFQRHGWEERNWLQRENLEQYGNSLYLNCSEGYTLHQFVKNHWIIYLKKVNFIICKLYLKRCLLQYWYILRWEWESKDDRFLKLILVLSSPLKE